MNLRRRGLAPSRVSVFLRAFWCLMLVWLSSAGLAILPSSTLRRAARVWSAGSEALFDAMGLDPAALLARFRAPVDEPTPPGGVVLPGGPTASPFEAQVLEAGLFADLATLRAFTGGMDVPHAVEVRESAAEAGFETSIPWVFREWRYAANVVCIARDLGILSPDQLVPLFKPGEVPLTHAEAEVWNQAELARRKAAAQAEA